MGQGVIPNDWSNGEYCRYAVQWPNSPQWLAVLRGVLTLPATGRFWDEKTGIIVFAQDVIKQTFDCNLHLSEVIMACNDNGLLEIAAAIRSLSLPSEQVCDTPSNGGIQLIVEGDEGVNIAIYGSEEPGSLEIGTTPPEYPGDLEEYDVDKCRTAAAMVDAWIQSIRNLASINFASSVGLTLVVIGAVAGLIILPAFLVPVLIAAAIGHVGINAALSSLADEMEGAYDDLVCIFYENSSTQVISNLLADSLDALISLIPATGAIAVALRTIALVLMNTDTINQLFTLTHGVGAEHDCSGCGVSFALQFQDQCDTIIGSLVEGVLDDGGPTVAESVDYTWLFCGSSWHIQFLSVESVEGPAGVCWHLDSIEIVGTLPGDSNWAWLGILGDGTVIEVIQDEMPPLQDYRRLGILMNRPGVGPSESASPFTVEFTWSPC